MRRVALSLLLLSMPLWGSRGDAATKKPPGKRYSDVVACMDAGNEYKDCWCAQAWHTTVWCCAANSLCNRLHEENHDDAAFLRCTDRLVKKGCPFD
jgi:hypothetical protein